MFVARDHQLVMFRGCRRPLPDRSGCGGVVFWQPAEPQWALMLGYVGICCLCGWQVFTADLLGDKADEFRGRHLPTRMIGGLKTAA